MKRLPVSSSSIRTVGYDAKTRALEVEFLNGRVYRYADVPEVAFDALMGADSLGRYFNTNIRDHYPFVQL